MINPFTALGPKTRKTIYVIFGFCVILAGSAAVYFNGENPEWLDGVNRVLTYLAAPISVLAASNTPAAPAEIVEAAEEIVDEEDSVDDDAALIDPYDIDPNRP